MYSTVWSSMLPLKLAVPLRLSATPQGPKLCPLIYYKLLLPFSVQLRTLNRLSILFPDFSGVSC